MSRAPERHYKGMKERELGARASALVLRVRGGDTEAFRELFALVEPSAFALAFSHLHHSEDARDVVQEAALESFRKLSCLKEPAAFPAWVCSMVRFLSFRMRRRRRSLSLEDLAREPAAADRSEGGQEGPDPAVGRALSSLPARYREVLVLRHMEGRNYEEISELLGLTPAGVDSRLSRARAMLRRKLRLLEGIRR